MQLSVTLLQVMGLHFQEPTSSLFVRLLSHQPAASSTFLSEQTSHQQSASSTFLSEQISTSHQPNEQTEGRGQEEKCREHVSR
jgi:hypothetical protein